MLTRRNESSNEDLTAVLQLGVVSVLSWQCCRRNIFF